MVTTVTKITETVTTVTVGNEGQARELASLRDDPDELREVWAEAVERTAGRPTAAAIREVREERTAPAPMPAPTSMPERKPARRPLTDAIRDAAYNAMRAAESVQRITHDDRWSKNAPKVDPLTRDNLRRAVALLSAAVDSLTEGEQ